MGCQLFYLYVYQTKTTTPYIHILARVMWQNFYENMEHCLLEWMKSLRIIRSTNHQDTAA